MNVRLIIISLPIATLIVSIFAAQNDSSKFFPPDERTRLAAVGNLTYLPEDQRSAFTPSAAFPVKTPPKASDWLASHREPGQSFDQFLLVRRNLFVPPRQKLYIQPIGEFTDKEKSLLPDLHEYMKLFFQAEVVVQSTIDLGKSGFATRLNSHSNQTQILTTDILNHLKGDLPKDAYARIAVTITDLYPQDSWNFVFGQASYRERVGVFSFARFGEFGTTQFFRRCIQVTSHEMGHMYGIMHCVYFQCVMNGSNHLQESDSAPLFLCPVCLRKLHSSHSFKVQKRYQEMHEFLTRHKLVKEAEWLKRRLAELK